MKRFKLQEGRSYVYAELLHSVHIGKDVHEGACSGVKKEKVRRVRAPSW